MKSSRETLNWLRERYANSLRLSGQKTGEDKAGWQEDALYFASAISHIKETNRLRELLQKISDMAAPLPPEAFNVTVLHHSRCEIFDIAERAKEVWSHDCKYPEQ